MKDRYKNYSFWTALAGAVVVFLNALGDCFGFSIDNELVSGLIMSIAGLLVVFGIVTMPTNDKNDLGGDKAEESEEENQDENESPNKDEVKTEETGEERVDKTEK